MKKTIAILLSLFMLLAACATAFAATYTAGDYYTITYPDDLTLDDTSYTDENTEDSLWLFELKNDTLLIDAYWNELEDYADFSLSNADESDKQLYLTEVGNTFADYNPEWVSAVTAESGLVFYVFQMEDSEGVYLYAEAIENGVSANFVCYYFNGEPDDALVQTLGEILYAVVPPPEE
jgi:hypothetical protein